MAKIRIQGIDCEYRDKRPDEIALYENLPKEEQYFRREEPPFTQDEIIGLARKERFLTEVQDAWVKKQEKFFDEGVYCYINGTLKFFPGSYWDYLNNTKLEDGTRPEHRESDRKYYIFLDHCERDPDIYGVVRGKARRQGVTSMSVQRILFKARRTPNANMGMISKTYDDAKKIFTSMLMYSFKALLPPFQPDFSSMDDSKTELRLVKEETGKKRGLGALEREGLNTVVNYKATALNSYDSMRLTLILIDESGKFPKEVNINDYWEKIFSTLRVGRDKVGFAYLPTTVNPLKNGGEEFEILWKNSNQAKYGTKTPTKLVRYFTPANETLKGFIDKYGDCDEEAAKEYILSERLPKTGNAYLIHRQEYPLNEDDMFAFAYGACEFNEKNLLNEKKRLETDPVFLRQVRLILKKEIEKSIYPGKPDKLIQKVSFMDDATGGWFILEKPSRENAFTDYNGFLEPANTAGFIIGVDTTQDRIAIDGSNPCILVFKKSCIIDGEEYGNYPVAMWIAPTRLDIHFDEEVKKACMWYGCKANYEIDRRTDFYRYFCKEGCQSFLQWTPQIARNPLHPKKPPEYGTRSGDPFQLAQQLQVAKMYIDGTEYEGYNGHVHRIQFPTLIDQLLKYNHLERTKSDQPVALMMALLPCFGEVQAPFKPKTLQTILPQYKIKIPA